MKKSILTILYFCPIQQFFSLHKVNYRQKKLQSITGKIHSKKCQSIFIRNEALLLMTVWKLLERGENTVENTNDQQINPLLIFMHVQKTGGTTLLSILKKQYPPNERVIWGKHFKGPRVITQKMKEEARCVHHAHAPFGVHLFYPKQSFTYITMFRDPVDQIISHYYYIRRDRYHPLHSKLNRISLKQFLADPDVRCKRLTRNVQTQLACGTRNPAKANLEKAKRNLQKYFSVVGVTELFDETLFLIKDRIGWKDFSYQKKNVTKNRPKKEVISDEVIQLIKDQNKLDVELYHWAKQNLISELEELDTSKKEEMEKFIKLLNN